MRRMALGMVVMVGVIWVAATVWAQTNLTVVRHSDDTLWAMTCSGLRCNPEIEIRGKFTSQPSLTWDPSIQKYILIGVGQKANGIYRSTFNADGTFNNDWTLLPGTSYSPVAVSGGAFLGNLSITNANLAANSVTPDKIAFYHKVAIVALTGGNYADPVTAMANLNLWCGTPSATSPCMMKIMPGVYDIGTKHLAMQSYVDIEGSGENTTIITGNSHPGVVSGASNAEIRFLTVKNTGGVGQAWAIYNQGLSLSAKMTNVTASASGGIIDNYGVYNVSSSPTMTNVTASASGGTNNCGVRNNSSSPTMTNVTASASGGTNNYGVYNNSSSPTMTNVTASASGGTTSYNFGVRNDSSSPTMTNVTASASGGIISCGVSNNSSSPTMTNVTASASGTGSCGVWNVSSSPTMTNVTASASGGNSDVGISSSHSGTIRINHSVIKGSSQTVRIGSGVTTYIGNTQLDGGPVYNNGGTLICAGVYDENYTFYASTCP